MFGLFRKNPRRDIVLSLYGRMADAARAPWLYLQGGVPDTVEGRLEALTIHALLLMRRLKALPDPAPEVAQEFIDVLFEHIDHGLRELGVGDTTVPKRMKKIAQNFYGRAQAYAEPLDAGDPAGLAAALERNIPGVASSLLAPYLQEAERRLQQRDLDDLLQDRPLFDPPSEQALRAGAAGGTNPFPSL